MKVASSFVMNGLAGVALLLVGGAFSEAFAEKEPPMPYGVTAAQAKTLLHVSGKVTLVESTYMPNNVVFRMQVDTGSGMTQCPSGTWMMFESTDPERVKANFSLLMAALVSSKRATTYVNSGDASCKSQHLHILSDP